MTHPTTDLLAAILAATRRVVACRREAVPASEMERRAASFEPRGARFVEALANAGTVNVIAECKRRSPSRGVLRAAYDPAAIAAEYEQAGAAAISVLTEPAFFDGSLEHLAAVRERVALPLLRKDFVLDEYQLLEARAAGADAILLIVAALDDGSLRRLAASAASLGLAALVEVHDERELERAVAAGAAIIGVNNRNLKTLDVDTEASMRLAPAIPEAAVGVAESGLKTGGDLRRLRAAGYRGFLVGERLMSAARPGEALAALLEEGGR
jgi:indole-3-glycerol phosphate synthase